VIPERTSGAGDAYRRALAEGVPAAGDDRAYGLGMAAACLVTAIERLTRFARLDRRPAGHESRAQMVSTLEAAARTAHRFESLPHLAGWVQATAAALRRRWPGADHHYSDAYTTRE